MKIGFYGGSFDPPHRGHIALARLAMDRLTLDRVLLAPVGVQPLKRDHPQADFADRVAMTRLAIADEPGMDLSLIDAPRPDGRPNYTVDTIRALRGTLSPADSIVCLMGADSFLSIGRWYRSADLLVACDFAVAARPGFDLGRIAAALPASISVASCDTPQESSLVLCLRGGPRRESRLYLLPELDEPVSASTIRDLLHRVAANPATGDRARVDSATADLAILRSAIDARVAAYIHEHGLYRGSRPS